MRCSSTKTDGAATCLPVGCLPVPGVGGWGSHGPGVRGARVKTDARVQGAPPGARRVPVLRDRPVPTEGAAGGVAPASPGADEGGGTGIGTGSGRDAPGSPPPALLRRCPARCCSGSKQLRDSRVTESVQDTGISSTSCVSIQYHHGTESIQDTGINTTSSISIQHHHTDSIQDTGINTTSSISIQHHHETIFIQDNGINTASSISIQHHHTKSIQDIGINSTSNISIQHHHTDSIQDTGINSTSSISIQHHHTDSIQDTGISSTSSISIQHHHGTDSIQDIGISSTSSISIQHHHGTTFSQDTGTSSTSIQHVHGTDSIPPKCAQIHGASIQLDSSASPILTQALWARSCSQLHHTHCEPWAQQHLGHQLQNDTGHRHRGQQLRAAAELWRGRHHLPLRLCAGGGHSGAAGAAVPAQDPPWDPPLPPPGRGAHEQGDGGVPCHPPHTQVTPPHTHRGPPGAPRAAE
ncbi:uncharacterized protein LOC113957067 [Corapipo altera]|uniref:uncharacterized protein LOC113957067 n=1 Tax=Corapipo altera TaxID=415028 RepID=UPI000FD66C2C|nr:uncharacterized protein LOC113957067 [Corapipo altera]